MKRLVFFAATVIFALPTLQLSEQQSVTVNLRVIHDGRVVPAPAEVMMSFGGHSFKIKLQKGKFVVSREVLSASRVTLETDIEDSHIRLTKLVGSDFAEKNWTLRLAEQANVDYYDWPGPRSADIATSCMVDFNSTTEEPERGHFEEHCRSKTR